MVTAGNETLVTHKVIQSLTSHYLRPSNFPTMLITAINGVNNIPYNNDNLIII